MVLPSAAEYQHEDPSRSIYDLDSYFLDHLSDFDPIKEWLIDPDHPNPMPDSDILNDSVALDSINAELGHQSPILEPSIDERMEKVSLVESKMDSNGDDGKNAEVVDAIKWVVGGGETKNDGASEDCPVSDPIKIANESDEEERSEDESEDSSSESSSSSSSSSSDEDEEGESSSSDEEEEKEEDDNEKVAAAIEVEEGEINGDDLDEVILGSDGEEAIPNGPIKSKHEFEDLPPVPPLEVSLEPHHQTLPVGFVSSILGNRVIVEGSEKHSPLNEGSILWITETRVPLGIIDELFGPVKNPYYIVRYNSVEEVPPGMSIGVAISYVVDFANHILNEKHLYQKGYDTSGVDDKEITDEVEFSDDEKEAEYKRSLRQNKRDANHENHESGFGKKKNNIKGAGIHRGKQLQSSQSLPVGNPSQCGEVLAPPAAVSNCNSSHGASSPMMIPTFPSQPQAFQMGVSGALGNTSQQFNTVSAQVFPPQPHTIGIQGGGSAPQPSPVGIQGGFPVQAQPTGVQGGFPVQAQPTGIQGGFHQLHPMGMQGAFPLQSQLMTMQGGLPMNWLPAQQFGEQIANLHHQNQVLNALASGVMPYQHQLVPNFGALPGNLPWFFGSANPSNGPSLLPIELMGQGGFGQVPFRCGNMNSQGNVALGNEQSHGQSPAAVNQGEMRPPSMQFNGRQFNPERPSSRGRRPYLRGGHRSIGHRGGSKQNG